MCCTTLELGGARAKEGADHKVIEGEILPLPPPEAAMARFLSYVLTCLLATPMNVPDHNAKDATICAHLFIGRGGAA